MQRRINTQPTRRPPPPAAAETRQLHHRRSSSFSSFGRSLSRILPSNRKERGGTIRVMGEGKTADLPDSALKDLDASSRDVGGAGAVHESGGGVGADMRKTRSWSPKKSGRNYFEEGHADTGVGVSAESRKAGTLRRFWGLCKVSRVGNTELELEGREDEHERKGRKQSVVRNNAHGTPKTDVPINDDVSVLGRSQQLYEAKRSWRKERRSFQESDDFLGVQGVNPKTGYPDPSPITSSDEPSYVSEEMRKKLEDNERRTEATKREYAAALLRREAEIKRLMDVKEKKKKEKRERTERKREELRARMKGRWRSDGDGWNMVAEPVLSPIQQSNAGTPRYGEKNTTSFKFLRLTVTRRGSTRRQPLSHAVGGEPDPVSQRPIWFANST